MSSSLVWVQLYYKTEGKDEPVGNPIFIKKESLDPPIIGALAAAVLPKLDPPELAEVFVYPPGTEPSSSAHEPLQSWDPVPSTPSNSSGPPQPLIVVAPAPTQANAISAQTLSKLVEGMKIASDDNREVVAYVRTEMDNKTANKEMSKASQEWAEAILAGYNVKHDRVTKVEDGVGSMDDLTPYVWTTTEHAGTEGARNWLKQHFLSDTLYDLKLVTGTNLPPVKASRKSSTGRTDIVIGLASDIKKGSPLDFAMGIIELKTDKYPLKVGQNLLQLLSLSVASAFKKGVILLATDCTTKWELFYFSDAKTITSKVYDHGSKVRDDFLQLLNSANERKNVDQNEFWIASLPEVAEQNLEGFDLSDHDKKKAKAEEEQLMLEHFADKLGEIYGERPTIPWWARVDAKIPDYYA